MSKLTELLVLSGAWLIVFLMHLICRKWYFQIQKRIASYEYVESDDDFWTHAAYIISLMCHWAVAFAFLIILIFRK